MEELYDRALMYIDLSSRAREKLSVISPENTHLRRAVDDALDMVDRYISDAKHFFDAKDYSRALCAASYAHGWLDCLARMGMIDVGRDSELFTVD
ncbi:MAG: DUF357 domain-containing protein [Candidatus Woesearchaeota archaeon]